MIENLLLVDDDELTSFLIKRLVKNKLAVKEFESRENGVEALAYLSDLKNGRLPFPEIILVDIDMPVMNGYDFVERYEANFWNEYPHTALVMITSSKRKMDMDKCMSYKSVHDCIFKPLTREKFMRVTEEIYHSKTAS